MNVIETTIRNCRKDIPQVVDAVDKFADVHHLAAEIVGDVQIALDEILTNIVNYGYTDDAEHEIRICLRVGDGVLETTVEDDGVPFNPLESAKPDTSAPLQERRIGGISFIARYGTGLLLRLYDMAALECPGHQVMEL